VEFVRKVARQFVCDVYCAFCNVSFLVHMMLGRLAVRFAAAAASVDPVDSKYDQI